MASYSAPGNMPYSSKSFPKPVLESAIAYVKGFLEQKYPNGLADKAAADFFYYNDTGFKRCFTHDGWVACRCRSID